MWCFDNGCVSFESEKWTVSLRAINDVGAIMQREVEGFFPLWLYEWTDYWVECRRASELSVTFGGERAADGPTPNLKHYAYQNQIGHSRIVITIDGEELPPLEVEVISRKLDKPPGDPLHYPTFYDNLRSDLTRRIASLPFEFSAPTFHFVEEVNEPPTPLFLSWFLRQNAERLRSAVNTILHNPHRLLTGEEEFLPISQAFEITPRTLQAIVEHPEYLHFPTPSHVLQSLPADTFDTPENRFVKHFLTVLCNTQYAIRNRHDVFGFLQLNLHAPLFDDVGEMLCFPAASQVLLKRDGYRELLQLWREFNLSRQPTFFCDAQESIDARDVATMYEYWCFFELAERLASSLYTLHFTLYTSDAEGLAWNVEAVFGDTAYRLVYNRSFSRGRGSYSVGLRPDFSLFHGDQLQVVFDAKFRFDERDVEELGREVDAEDAGMPMDAERLAKRADLYKMHTYRDALRCRAAVVLFPGESDRMYLTDGTVRRDVILTELLSGQVEGVGAMGFIPTG
jgi:hypothetical protein